MADATGDELLADLAAAAPRDLVLVDVARGDELVADLELRVRVLGGPIEHHQVVIGRVEIRERAVDFLAELLDADAGVEAWAPLAGEVQFRGAVAMNPCRLICVGSDMADS